MTNPDEATVSALYYQLLDAWNKRSAADFAGLFAADSNVVGFDGSQMNGQAEIEVTLRGIFDDHQTGRYVGKIREMRFLSPNIAVLRMVSGIVPAGQSELNPATNSIQTLVAAKQDGQWRIVMYQNTPAAFHGRPELAEALTQELRQLL
jgi:uncharacterized protein (TIGR02246 family)